MTQDVGTRDDKHRTPVEKPAFTK